MNSSENEPWADQFDGLTPATPAFSAVWKKIAQDEPIAFAQAQAQAQDDFMWDTKYTKYVDTVKAATQFDITTAPEPILEFALSFKNQSGGAATPTIDAVNATIFPIRCQREANKEAMASGRICSTIFTMLEWITLRTARPSR